MTGTAVEQVQAQDLQARQVLNRVLVTADQFAISSMLRDSLRLANGRPRPPEEIAADCRAIAITLHQHGLPVTIQNMNACFVVNGAVDFMTRLWTGLAMARGGHRVWVCDADPEKCRCTEPSSATEGRAHIQRADDGMTYMATFSMADAERAGLAGSATYKKFPQDMLGWRALSRVVKRYAPDIVVGVGDIAPQEVARPRPRPVAFDTSRPSEDDDITDAVLVDQGEDIHMGHGTAAPPGPAVDEAVQITADGADRDNAARVVVVGDPAAVPGPIDWRELATAHGKTPAGLLIQARAFAAERGVEEPQTLEVITDPGVAADLRNWLGEGE